MEKLHFKNDKIELLQSSKVIPQRVEEAQEDLVSVGMTFLCVNRQQPNYEEEEE
jgi:hypothetical protein